MSLLYQNQNQNINEVKRVNDSISEKIKQNKKQKVGFQNNIISNITSGLNTEKGIANQNKNNSDELNINNNINNINNNPSGSLPRNASQSSLSVDLNKYKITPNNFFFNNSKIKSKLNQNENFETFNPVKDNNIVNISTNIKENIKANNDNNNSNEKKINNMESLLKNFNPYDIKNFLGKSTYSKQKIKKK